MIVRLTYAELLLAHAVAAQRQVQNLKNRCASRYGAPEGPEGEVLDILACRGEMAVAKALNLYWSGNVGHYGAHDVGGLVDVRTRRQHWHDLIVHPEDPDDRPFVLVDGSACPEMRIAGWLLGREAKDSAFWKDPAGGRPAFFVPQARLRPIAELGDLLRAVA